MVELRQLAVASALFGISACGADQAHRTATPPPSHSVEEDLEDVARLSLEREDRVLNALGQGDPTVALRVGLVPTLAVPDADTEANWLSSRERGLGIDEAELELVRWSVPSKLLRARSPRAWDLLLERELVVRSVREERYRFDHERELPRCASELVRATIAAFKGAPSTDPVRAHERWIVRRLEEVRASLRGGGLSALELAELDDSLDPLERAATQQTSAAIVRLRVDLEATPRSPWRAPDPRSVERAVGAHLGVSFPLAVIRSRLERAEAGMREAAKAQAAGASGDEARAAEKAAEPLLFGASPCGGEESQSRMRRALPSPERAAGCAEVRVVATARGDLESLSALLALHDQVTIALWAVAMASEGLDPDSAQARHKMMSATPPERSVRFLRLAAVRPAAAIGAGLAAEMITRHGVLDAPRIARAWASFGDAPFDVIEREVLAKL